MSFELGVWLGQDHVANINERRTGSITLDYTDDALARYPIGRPLLSVSMPLRPGHRYPPAVTGPWLEGLLPEGEARTQIEAVFGVRRGDVFGLLEAIGRDCAGAVQLLPPGEPPTSSASRTNGDQLSPDDLEDAITALPQRPLGARDEVRLSLAGQQPKLLLVKDPDGTFRWPEHGAASTHILKPGDARFPGVVANEAFCLAVARRLDLTTIATEVRQVAGQDVLVVERYDRQRGDDGAQLRVHQEDACQALAVDTGPRGDGKYEASGGPSFADIARVLEVHNGDPAQTRRLAQVMTLTVVLGNADAHGKNLSFLLPPGGTLRLAPVYDIVSTIQYEQVRGEIGPRAVSRHLAMAVNGHWPIDAVARDDLVAEASRWHVPADVDAAVDELLDALPGAVDAALDEVAPPAELPTVVRRRAASLRAGRAAGA